MVSDTPPGKLISVEDQDDEEEDDDDENDEEEGQGVTIESAEETLETAWEVLETARVIYSKHPERKLQLADVYLCLGDLDMESGTVNCLLSWSLSIDNMQEAVSDYSQCLKLREELLGRDNRNLADMYLCYIHISRLIQAQTLFSWTRPTLHKRCEECFDSLW